MTLVFTKIRWKNFLSTGNYFSEIVLNDYPMTLISGKNGFGKSSAFDALTFALYGKPHRNINKPNLVNSINGQDCVVELEFQDNNDKYLIRRGIKPNIFEIHKNGALLNQTSKIKDYQKYLEQNILKINYSSFTQIVFLGAAGFVPFMELTPAERREVIEDILDIKIFSKMNIVVKKHLAETQQNIWILDGKLNTLNEQLKLHKQYLLKQNDDRAKIVSDNRDKIAESEKQIAQLCAQVQELTVQVNRHTESIKSKDKISKKIHEMTGLQATLSKRISKIDQTIEFYRNTEECPTCKQSINDEFKSQITTQEQNKKSEIQDGYKKISEQLVDVQLVMDSINQTQNTISELQYKISELQSSISSSTNFQKSLLSQIEELEKTRDVSKEQAEIDTITANLNSNKEEKEKHILQRHNLETLQILLKDSGIKAKIIRQYLPVMNKLINHYLGEMDFFVNFTLDENFNEIIKSRHRDEFTYASFSEGEKQRIDVALLLTWREIARLKNSANTNLLVMDEIFDRSLDHSAIQDVTKLLRTLSSKTNIFVISHRADIHADKFDNNITFTKNGDFSVIN